MTSAHQYTTCMHYGGPQKKGGPQKNQDYTIYIRTYSDLIRTCSDLKDAPITIIFCKEHFLGYLNLFRGWPVEKKNF